jgi:glycosyltransferase involved in cell wall biosynthesis
VEVSDGPPLRVAIVTPPLDASGGIGRLVSYLLEAIDPAEVVVTLVDSRGRHRRAAFSLVALTTATVELVRLRARSSVDVVHINLSKRASTARKVWLIGVAKLLGFPVVVHLHSGTYPEFFSRLPPVLRRAVRSMLGRADEFLVLGERWRSYAVDELGIKPVRVSVVRYGVPGPTQAVALRREHGQPLSIVFLGRLGDGKGTPELIQALHMLRVAGVPCQAILAGDGEIDRMSRMVRSLGLEELIQFPGWVSTEVTRELIDAAHLLVLPSHAEGLPAAVLEAFARARTVVTTNVGALPDIVVDGANGLVVAPGDPAALAQALERLAKDDELRVRLATAARATWEASLSPQVCAPQLVAVWRRAASGPALR